MAGEVIVVEGTITTLESSGASIANNAIGTATSTYNRSTQGNDFPDAEFVLSFTFGTAPAEGTLLSIYARPLDVDGTGDTEVPETSRPTMLIGHVVVNNVNTLQYSTPVFYRRVPKLANYYVHNNATGQTVSAGWALKVKPISTKLAP